MRKVELSLQERRRGRKKHSLTVRKVSVPKKGNRGGLKDFLRVGFRKSQWVHEFTDKHPVWEEGMIGNRARSMATLYYHKILKF